MSHPPPPPPPPIDLSGHYTVDPRFDRSFVSVGGITLTNSPSRVDSKGQSTAAKNEGKTPEGIAKTYDIREDFTPGQEEEEEEEDVEGKISNVLDLTGAEDRFIPEENLDQTGAISLIVKDSSIEVETRDLHHQTSPPKSPTYLYLPDRLEKLPDWISSPTYEKLTTLILKWNHLKEDPLETLGKLRELVELQLHRAYDGEQLNFKDEQFPKLKNFLLHELEGLRSMSLEKGTLPSLEILTISRCPWLTEIPSGIKDIHLNKLTLSDMSHEFYEKAKADHENDDYQIFKHIEEVYFTRWRAGYWESRTSQRTVDVKASQLNNE